MMARKLPRIGSAGKVRPRRDHRRRRRRLFPSPLIRPAKRGGRRHTVVVREVVNGALCTEHGLPVALSLRCASPNSPRRMLELSALAPLHPVLLDSRR
jgi:hypothetical protein